ncbi:hypothetical protein ABZS98_06030 [Streptomyces avermitilis]|uniref:hypothetical protein n=1 Tax=Streptomyces avermitilis TaxID=33903 RepID=UPI0033BE47A5
MTIYQTEHGLPASATSTAVTPHQGMLYRLHRCPPATLVQAMVQAAAMVRMTLPMFLTDIPKSVALRSVHLGGRLHPKRLPPTDEAAEAMVGSVRSYRS